MKRGARSCVWGWRELVTKPVQRAAWCGGAACLAGGSKDASGAGTSKPGRAVVSACSSRASGARRVEQISARIRELRGRLGLFLSSSTAFRMWGRAFSACLSRRRVKPVLNSRKASVSIMVSPQSPRGIRAVGIPGSGGVPARRGGCTRQPQLGSAKKECSAKPSYQRNGKHDGCENVSHPSHF